MHIPRLYIEKEIETGCELELVKEQAHRLGHVMRMRVNQPVIVFNGQGHEYKANIKLIGRKAITIVVEEKINTDRESKINITLALGVTKNQAMDFALQKAVELGISQFVPLITEFSPIRYDNNKLDKKLKHWQQLIISASEQSGRTRLCKLQSPVLFADWIITEDESLRIILHPYQQQSLNDDAEAVESITLIIGPEGGFSEEEYKTAINKGCKTLGLGPRILRTETAVITAISVCHTLWGDFELLRVK